MKERNEVKAFEDREMRKLLVLNEAEVRGSKRKLGKEGVTICCHH
jgi:hypothetical protein